MLSGARSCVRQDRCVRLLRRPIESESVSTNFHRVRAGDLTQPFGAGFRRSHLSVAIHRNYSESWAVAGVPFEVVEQRPVVVPANVDAVAEASRDAAQRAAYVLDTAIVLVCADAIFGDDDRYLRDCARLANVCFERFGPEFVVHHRGLDAGFGRQRAVGADAIARVGLDADEIVAERRLIKDVLAFSLDAIAALLAAVYCLQVRQREA